MYYSSNSDVISGHAIVCAQKLESAPAHALTQLRH